MKTVRPRFSVPACGLLLVSLLPRVLAAQSGNFEGQPIVALHFDPPAQPLEPSEIGRILPLKVGQPLTAESVRAAIARLFATGRYADIAVDAQPAPGGVAITFLTRHTWFVAGVRDEGKIETPPGANQLANAGSLDLGQPYTEAKLQDAEAAQRRLMELNGLFRPDLQPVFEWDDAHQQVSVRFEVDSGRRARFGPPHVTGDLKMEMDRILKALKLRRWLIHTWKPMTQTRMQQGLNGVRNLYQKADRLEATVSLEDVKYDPETNIATPSLHIDAGPVIDLRAIGARFPTGSFESMSPCTRSMR